MDDFLCWRGVGGEGFFWHFPHFLHSSAHYIDKLKAHSTKYIHTVPRIPLCLSPRPNWDPPPPPLPQASMPMGRRPLPSVRDLTRDGRWNTL